MDIYKKVNVGALIGTIAIWGSSLGYSSLVCQKYGEGLLCGKDILSPLETAGLILSVFLVLFLFLPSHYFRVWLVWVCSWMIPIMVFFILDATGRGLDFSKTDMIEFLTVPFASVTLLFLTGRYFWLRRKNRLKV